MKAYNELKVSLVRHTILPIPRKRYRKAKSKDVFLLAEIWIDDTRLYHPGFLVYLQQLIASAEKSGNYLILCNGCGIAACGCRETSPIKVVHQQNAVVWRRNDDEAMALSERAIYRSNTAVENRP